MVDIFDPAYDESVEIEIEDNRIEKGDDINLKEKDPTLTHITVGVGWTVNSFDTDELDVDVSCFLLNNDDKTRVDNDFVFYNNMEASDGAVVHNGDSRTGAGEGDDETISIDLNGLPFDIGKVMFVFSIYKGEEREQTMSSVRNGYLRVINTSNNHEILRYDLHDEVQGHQETGMYVGALTREGPKWHFKAIGEFAQGGLSEIATGYDIIVQMG